MKTKTLTLVALGSLVAGCGFPPGVSWDKIAECTGKPDGMPLAQQTPGDCVVLVCDGQGNKRVDLSPTDIVDDLNPCTIDECKAGEMMHTALPQGTTIAEQVAGDCHRAQCNGQGGVEDVVDDTDRGAVSECGSAYCDNGTKVTQNAPPSTECGAGGSSKCNGDGVCVSWCAEQPLFPGEDLQWTGGTEGAVATGDFDNDGKLDLVFADYWPNHFRVLRGLGGGNFSAPATYDTAPRPSSVTPTDLDLDGYVDLVVAEYLPNDPNNPGGVHIFFNRGSANPGVFEDGPRYQTGNGAYQVAAADLNGDGKSDLAVVNLAGGSVSVLMNLGNKTFASPQNYAVGIGPCAVVAAELDGQPGIDLAVATETTQQLILLWNDGGGTFPQRNEYALGDSIHGITAGDINGDAKIDLMVANYWKSSVATLLNQGNRIFNMAETYPTGKSPQRLTNADLDGDTHLDIVSTNYADGTVSVLRNKGDGTFSDAVNYAMGNNVFEVVAADFNGDMKPDIVASNGTSYLRMLTNDGMGGFPMATPHYKTGKRPTSIAARDFNGDSFIDLAVTNLDDNTVTLLANDGADKFSDKGRFGGKDKLAQPTTIVSEDFDGDGRPDWAVSESSIGKVAVFRNMGNNVFAAPEHFDSGEAHADAVAAADIDGDHDFDLLVAHRDGNGAGTLGVLLNDGTGMFGPPIKFAVGDQVAGTDRATIGVADLNRDGFPDVVMGRADKPVIYFLKNLGGGNFAAPQSFPTAYGLSFITIADVDGNGWGDIIHNQGSVTKNAGHSDFGLGTTLCYSSGNGTIAATDLNGDGKLDLAEASSSTAELNIFFRNAQTEGFLAANHYAAGVHESYNGSIAAADLNHDGRPDLAVIDDDGVRIYFNTCSP